MKKNMGSIDKTVRIIIGLVIIALGIIYQSWWELIGILPLGTGLVSRCLLYYPLGFRTNKSEEVKN